MPAKSAEPRIARNGGTFFTVKTTSSASGSRFSAVMLNSFLKNVERRLGAHASFRLGGQPEHEEDDEADPERRARSPEHVPDVLTGREAAADELRHEDRRLRERRHLVAEVGAADHGAGGDRLREAHHLGHADEGDAERAGRRPRAAGDHPDEGADRRGRHVEDRRVEQPHAVVDDGRDRAGHVPGADQRADREQDEDRAHRRGHAADRGVGDRGRRVAVLERHQARERRAEQQRDLQRPVRRADSEERRS